MTHPNAAKGTNPAFQRSMKNFTKIKQTEDNLNLGNLIPLALLTKKGQPNNLFLGDMSFSNW